MMIYYHFIGAPFSFARERRAQKLREDLLSVGIDIGTSTTQLVFSKITIENTASAASVPNIRIVETKVIYRSNIHFTPLISPYEIDGLKVRELIEEEYRKANVSPKEVNTGAVIITGETARKENASIVLDTLSGLAGDFVVATAGPELEAIIAGKGAGAQKISKETGRLVVNLDIGGGTTNIVVFHCGEVVDTVCLDIGGRLIKLRNNSTEILYIAPKLKSLAKDMGIQLQVGKKVDLEIVKLLTEKMADILMEALGLKSSSEALKKMLIGKGLKKNYPIDYITFSGGVADYIYKENRDNYFKYDDIGVLLGQSIRKSQLMKDIELATPIETIRATVVGAGSHTVDISGSTITFTKDMLPLKSIPILKMTAMEELLPREEFIQRIKEKIRWFRLENHMQQVALAIKGVKNPSFEDVQYLASNLIKGMEDVLDRSSYLIVIVENDIAKVLGQTMYKHLGYSKDVLCIDSVVVDNGDYIDIGKPVANGRVVPIVIKTLVFNS